jgi:hypothetical protein
MGGIFSAVKNLITAHCLNCMFSRPTISIGTEPELWIAVDLRLHMVEGRYHVAAWNWFYPVFIAPIKNMAEEVKLFSLSSYFTLLLTNNLLLPFSFSVMCLCVFMVRSTLAIVNVALPGWKSEGGAWRVIESISLTNKFRQYLRLILTSSFYHLEGGMWAFHIE